MQEYLIFSTLMLGIGIAGLFINRKNIIVLLMCIELILLAANTNFILFSKYWGDISGQAFVFFVMTVAAAESAIGLALLVLIFREKHSINVKDLDQLKG
jgi:NADH-quinone oxidoreductase subunit K